MIIDMNIAPITQILIHTQIDLFSGSREKTKKSYRRKGKKEKNMFM